MPIRATLMLAEVAVDLNGDSFPPSKPSLAQKHSKASLMIRRDSPVIPAFAGSVGGAL